MTRLPALDRVEFERLLDVHGARLERWPAGERQRLDELLAASREARSAWARAERLEATLDAWTAPEPSAALMARLATIAVHEPQHKRGFWPFALPITPVVAWAFAAAFGVLVGSQGMFGMDAMSASEETGQRGDAALVLDGTSDSFQTDDASDWSEPAGYWLDTAQEDEP
jgi:ferric-dicitrate binding protein FerR (iron transport regulator)